MPSYADYINGQQPQMQSMLGNPNPNLLLRQLLMRQGGLNGSSDSQQSTSFSGTQMPQPQMLPSPSTQTAMSPWAATVGGMQGQMFPNQNGVAFTGGPISPYVATMGNQSSLAFPGSTASPTRFPGGKGQWIGGVWHQNQPQQQPLMRAQALGAQQAGNAMRRPTYISV